MIVIDVLKQKYIDELCEIESASFSNAWTKENFAGELNNPTSVFFVALNGGEVVGCVAMNNALGEGFISKLMVDSLVIFFKLFFEFSVLTSLIEEVLVITNKLFELLIF